MVSFEPSWAAVVGLVALGPVVVFAVDRNAPVVALSAACVALIAVSVYYLFGGEIGLGRSATR